MQAFSYFFIDQKNPKIMFHKWRLKGVVSCPRFKLSLRCYFTLTLFRTETEITLILYLLFLFPNVLVLFSLAVIREKRKWRKTWVSHSIRSGTSFHFFFDTFLCLLTMIRFIYTFLKKTGRFWHNKKHTTCEWICHNRKQVLEECRKQRDFKRDSFIRMSIVVSKRC